MKYYLNNDINATLDEIQKNIEDNHEKISTDSKKRNF